MAFLPRMAPLAPSVSVSADRLRSPARGEVLIEFVGGSSPHLSFRRTPGGQVERTRDNEKPEISLLKKAGPRLKAGEDSLMDRAKPSISEVPSTY